MDKCRGRTVEGKAAERDGGERYSTGKRRAEVGWAGGSWSWEFKERGGTNASA